MKEFAKSMIFASMILVFILASISAIFGIGLVFNALFESQWVRTLMLLLLCIVATPFLYRLFQKLSDKFESAL